MPCGGIWPMDSDEAPGDVSCFHCHLGGADHICMEWDAFLHGDCVKAFLRTDEGAIVIAHEHVVTVRTSDGIVQELYKESRS